MTYPPRTPPNAEEIPGCHKTGLPPSSDVSPKVGKELECIPGQVEPISGVVRGNAEIDLAHVLAHSFRDFHVKGFDYLCLRRSEAETVKVYFFDGDVAQAPEAVIPHDHRYPFWTDCLAGAVTNHEFIEFHSKRYRDEAELYERFEYLTPLNGGGGFKWEREAWLFRATSRHYGAGDGYAMQHSRLHTITVRPDTVLRLVQFADVLALDEPTHAYRAAGEREPLSLAGLYRPMDPDHALMRIAQYEALGGSRAPLNASLKSREAS